MYRNPSRRRDSVTISENFAAGRVFINSRDALYALMEETFAEAKKAAREKIGKAEHAEHMGKISAKYKSDVGPASREEHGASAEDVYNMIVSMIKEAEGKGISSENVAKVINVLDGIRQSWAENPEPGDHHGRGSGMNRTSYPSEKAELAAYFSEWIVKSMVGGARQFDQRPGFGSQSWINAADTGGEAPGRKAGPERRPGEGAGSWSNPHARGREVLHPGESRQRTGTTIDETIQDLAACIPECIDDTWQMLSEDQAAPVGTQGTPGNGQDMTKQIAADFAEADRAAGVVKGKLAALIKSPAFTPDMRQKFLQFAESISKAINGA